MDKAILDLLNEKKSRRSSRRSTGGYSMVTESFATTGNHNDEELDFLEAVTNEAYVYLSSEMDKLTMKGKYYRSHNNKIMKLLNAYKEKDPIDEDNGPVSDLTLEQSEFIQAHTITEEQIAAYCKNAQKRIVQHQNAQFDKFVTSTQNKESYLEKLQRKISSHLSNPSANAKRLIDPIQLVLNFFDGKESE